MIEEVVPEPIEYRIHYNDAGEIYMCSMQQHPESTQYIVVTRDEYDNYFKYTVVNGMLKMIDNNTGLHVKLKSSDQGFAAVENHASLLVEPGEDTKVSYWSANV